MAAATKTGIVFHFSRLALRVAAWSGTPSSVIAALTVIVLWLLLGPLFKFSDSWQMIISTVTSIVTLLMVFVIQGTQKRDTAALQIKLDELILVMGKANNVLLDIEQRDVEELEMIRQKYVDEAAAARQNSGSE